MTSQYQLESITLESLCQQQGQPFKWLSRGDKTKTRTLRYLGGEHILPFRSSEMYCGRASDVVIFGKSYVLEKLGRAVFANQSHRDYAPDEYVQYYIDEIQKETRPRALIAPECCFLGGFSGHATYFGHFFFEFLYRLVAFDMLGLIGKLPIAVYDGVPDSWLSFVELYGVPKEHIVRVPQLPAPQFSSVWVASCPNRTTAEREYAFWDEGVQHLCRDLRNKALTGAAPGPKRIYLGRRGVKHRKVLNEDEVWAFLATRGFEYPAFEGKSAAEQIQLIGSADIIVAVGGSGTSMTQFARADCMIIDVLPPHLVGGLGSFGFAAVLGQSYSRLHAVLPKTDETPGITTDFAVEMSTLMQFVDYALKRVSG